MPEQFDPQKISEAGALLLAGEMSLRQIADRNGGRVVRPVLSGPELAEARQTARDMVLDLIRVYDIPATEAARRVFGNGQSGYATANVLYCTVFRILKREAARLKRAAKQTPTREGVINA